MNAVIGMTSLLLDTDLTPEQREFTETVRTSGDTLLTIINDILDFSKIEAGKMDLEHQPFDLRNCIEGALDLLATRAAQKGLDLAYLVEPQVPAAIYGDAGRLRQILVNLLSNAVKFTEEGEVVLSVTCSAPEAVGADQGLELHFAVRDTGIGVPADQMDRLFRSFSQLDASATRRYGGTGLGLAISKRLSEMMGGTMWAESPTSVSPRRWEQARWGPGSTFHFTIQSESAPSIPRAYLRDIQPYLRDKQVLIVDDNRTNRQILTLQTRAWGMLPKATGSPAEALDWIQQGVPFDVAILDMQMPEMDGLKLAAKIRDARPDPMLPLVMLTSLGQRESGTNDIQFAAFLTKPIKPSQLYNVLVGIFARDAQPADERTVAARASFDTQMARRLPLRILLAEDNVINQQVALSFLGRLGYRADIAANGLEVLQSLRRQPYDVVLMDVHMPEMDGLEATRQIRGMSLPELAAGTQPRIIAMTAGALQEDREACLEAGMDDYISKPVQIAELVTSLSGCQPESSTIPMPPADPVSKPGVTAPAMGSEVLESAALARLRATLGRQADTILPGLIEGFSRDGERLLA
ncbi:MAG TPA: response regulator, partial [Anaerolineae bacterium]|nr:response regulator [Anaerolineae bacterium]